MTFRYLSTTIEKDQAWEGNKEEWKWAEKKWKYDRKWDSKLWRRMTDGQSSQTLSYFCMSILKLKSNGIRANDSHYLWSKFSFIHLAMFYHLIYSSVTNVNNIMSVLLLTGCCYLGLIFTMPRQITYTVCLARAYWVYNTQPVHITMYIQTLSLSLALTKLLSYLIPLYFTERLTC